MQNFDAQLRLNSSTPLQNHHRQVVEEVVKHLSLMHHLISVFCPEATDVTRVTLPR